MTHPNDRKYCDSHEWAKPEGDYVLVGISDYAQSELGDIVFVELPEIGVTLRQGESFAVVESVKAVSNLYMPVSGEIVKVNDALEASPEDINADANANWIIAIKAQDPSQINALMDAMAYEAALGN